MSSPSDNSSKIEASAASDDSILQVHAQLQKQKPPPSPPTSYQLPPRCRQCPGTTHPPTWGIHSSVVACQVSACRLSQLCRGLLAAAHHHQLPRCQLPNNGAHAATVTHTAVVAQRKLQKWMHMDGRWGQAA